MVGIASGGPLFQQSYIRIEDARTLFHMEDVSNFFVASVQAGEDVDVVMNRIEDTISGVGNLDSKSGHEVMTLFHNIAKQDHKTVVIVSHDERIKDIADRALWIEDGKVSTAPPEPEVTVIDHKQKFIEHPYKYVGSLK